MTETYRQPTDLFAHIKIALARKDFPNIFYGPEHGETGARVQIGAGWKQIDGWHNLDYPTFDADRSMPIPLEDNTCRLVACYNTFDHLTPEQVINVLRDVQRVLMPNGSFVCVVPHYSSQLANECLMHRSRWAIDTWRNIFREDQYDGMVDGRKHKWQLAIRDNFIFGLTERNVFLVTRLVKET